MYRFRSVWRLPRSREDLWDEIESLLRSQNPVPWWGAVTAVASRPDGYDLVARSCVGYRLRFTLHDLDLDRPTAMTFRSRGDLVGQAALAFADDGADRTRVTIDWRVDVTVDWMRRTEWMLRPVFVLAHTVIMASGERRLRRWLRAAPRRRSP